MWDKAKNKIQLLSSSWWMIVDGCYAFKNVVGSINDGIDESYLLSIAMISHHIIDSQYLSTDDVHSMIHPKQRLLNSLTSICLKRFRLIHSFRIIRSERNLGFFEEWTSTKASFQLYFSQINDVIFLFILYKLMCTARTSTTENRIWFKSYWTLCF